MAERTLQPFVTELSRLGVESQLGSGALLWKEGDPGDHVVLLLEGMLEVTHETPQGEVIVLRSVDAGAVVGEIASLDGRSRSATVRAATPCRILRIPASEFRSLLRSRSIGARSPEQCRDRGGYNEACHKRFLMADRRAASKVDCHRSAAQKSNCMLTLAKRASRIDCCEKGSCAPSDCGTATA